MLPWMSREGDGVMLNADNKDEVKFCQFYADVVYGCRTPYGRDVRRAVRAERSCVTVSDAVVVMTAQSPAPDESIPVEWSFGRTQLVPSHGCATIVHRHTWYFRQKGISRLYRTSMVHNQQSISKVAEIKAAAASKH